MSDLEKFIESVKSYLSIHLFNIGETNITVWLILNVLFFLFLLLFLTAKIKNLTLDVLQRRSHISPGVGNSIATIVRYVLVITGIAIILQTLGVNLSSLMVLAGALGVGIGFGLQNIVNNLISGIIILFERPIKVGDRVEIGDIQ